MGIIGDTVNNFTSGTPNLGSIGQAADNYINNRPDYGTIGNAANDFIQNGNTKKQFQMPKNTWQAYQAPNIPVTGFQYQQAQIPMAQMLPTTNNLYNYLMR